MNSVKQYRNWLKEVKVLVSVARAKAALAVNEQLIIMYWLLGRMIVAKQQEHQWGDAVIEKLSADLQKAFPEMKGFSRANLFNCKKWFLFYSDKKVQQAVGQSFLTLKYKSIKVQQPVGQIDAATKKLLYFLVQIPWGHNIILIEKTNSVTEAVFYIRETIINNWSRNVLLNQLALQLHKRNGKAVTNFAATLPANYVELAEQTLKTHIFSTFYPSEKSWMKKIWKISLLITLLNFYWS